MLVLFQSIYPLHLTSNFPGCTQFFLANKFLFLVIPIPFWLFSAFVAFRKRPTSEINVLYLGILAVIYSFLFFCVISVIAFPCIPMIK